MSIYSVKVRPILVGDTYGPEIDISQYLKGGGAISPVTATVDATDFSLGIFSYTYLKLRLMNYDRRLSDSNDPNSIFPSGRDKALVTVSFPGFIFTGIISEEASRDADEDLRMVIVSREAIIRKAIVAPGTIPSGMKFSEAIASILSRHPIRNVITLDQSRINMDIDLEIENGPHFDGVKAEDAINQLLIAGNSYLYCDQMGRANVEPRIMKTAIVRNFYGPYDKLQRRPVILAVKNYSDGRHRAFNSFIAGGVVRQSQDHIEQFSFREKTVEVGFLESDESKVKVAQNLLEKYQTPKVEMDIIVPTSDTNNINVGDPVTISYDRLRKPALREQRLHKYGKVTYSNGKYPFSKGNIRVFDDTRFIVYGRQDRPQDFTTTLKVREYGYRPGDSIIDTTQPTTQAVYGQAVYGQDRYA